MRKYSLTVDKGYLVLDDVRQVNYAKYPEIIEFIKALGSIRIEDNFYKSDVNWLPMEFITNLFWSSMQLPKKKFYFSQFGALRTLICNSFINGEDVAHLPVCVENLHLYASYAQNAASRSHSKLPPVKPLIKIYIMPPAIKKLTYCPRIYEIKEIPDSEEEIS